MAAVRRSSANNIQTIQGNDLRLFINPEGVAMILDQFGNQEPISNYIDGSNIATLGKISLRDSQANIFDDLAGALAYVQEFTTAAITETSFADGVFYFTVPANTEFLERDSFCSVYLDGMDLQFEDPYGLVTAFDNFAFYQNTKNNIVGDCSFKTEAFRATTGNNILGNCTFTGSNCFSASSGNNTLGNCIFEKGSHFILSQGDNKLGDCQFDTVTIEGYNFNGSAGNNTLRNCTFNATSDFTLSTGNNTLADCLFVGDNAFLLSTGNNTFGICEFQGAQAFRQSTGNNTFADNSKILGSDSFTLSTGNNTFGNICEIGANCFSNTVGNIYFGNECIFGSSCFIDSEIYGVFGNSCEFQLECFINFAGNLIFGDYCVFEDNCFQDAIPVKINFGITTFNGSSNLAGVRPKIEINCVQILDCPPSFCSNLIGRFNILSKLGVDETATLPTSIFSTEQICSIHIPNALQYNNGGGPDGDLVNLLANVINPDSLITYD